MMRCVRSGGAAVNCQKGWMVGDLWDPDGLPFFYFPSENSMESETGRIEWLTVDLCSTE